MNKPDYRIFCSILFVLVCFPVSLFGQNYETSFYGEESFRNQTIIPSGVLNVLRQDDEVKRCFNSSSEVKFSADLFEATKISLNDDRLPDLLVKAKDNKPENNCINGNAISFWVFVNKGNKYEQILYVYTITLNVEKKRSYGYHRIKTSRSTGNATYETFYVFDGKYYLEKREKEIPFKFL